MSNNSHITVISPGTLVTLPNGSGDRIPGIVEMVYITTNDAVEYQCAYYEGTCRLTQQYLEVEVRVLGETPQTDVEFFPE